MADARSRGARRGRGPIRTDRVRGAPIRPLRAASRPARSCGAGRDHRRRAVAGRASRRGTAGRGTVARLRPRDPGRRSSPPGGGTHRIRRTHRGDHMTTTQTLGAAQASDSEPTAGLVAGTTPYPWPYDGALSPERTALIVAGWNDEWWARCHDPAAVVDRIRRLAESVDTVITIDHAGPSRSRRSFDPAAGSVPTIAGSSVVTAAGLDAFYGSPLD